MRKIIRINGEPVERASADIVETEPGVYSVVMPGMACELRVVGDEITIGANRFTFAIEDPRKWMRSGLAGVAAGRASITAAMPGKVVRVLVRVGDQVVAGQGIVAMEAMKMQNELKAPRDGRVTAILVQENESVVAGTVLATIE